MAAFSVPRDASIIAGIASQSGGLAGAARLISAVSQGSGGPSISRGTLDGIISGRQAMGDKAYAAVSAFMNALHKDDPEAAKFVKDLGRAAAYSAGSTAQGAQPGSQLRAQIQRLKTYSEVQQKKEVSFFVRRVQDVSGKRTGSRGRGGSYGGGGGGGVDESSDAEWYAEYGAWVEEVDRWRDETGGELPDLEDLPF